MHHSVVFYNVYIVGQNFTPALIIKSYPLILRKITLYTELV